VQVRPRLYCGGEKVKAALLPSPAGNRHSAANFSGEASKIRSWSFTQK